MISYEEMTREQLLDTVKRLKAYIVSIEDGVIDIPLYRTISNSLKRKGISRDMDQLVAAYE